MRLRIDYFDGLRGAASLMVALIHFGCPYFGRGYLGVDFFSFISGFVILLTYQNSDSDLHFLCKRFVRLWAVIVPLALLCSII